MTVQEPGKLVVISGPSGVGKSTVVAEVIARYAPGLRLSVSATTREPRPGEQEGVEYHFLSSAEFEAQRAAGNFLECVEVFSQGHWYGTLWSEVGPSLQAGIWVLLEIDVKGAMEVLDKVSEAVTIFIQPKSLEELEHRLRSRGTEQEAAIQRRLSTATHELELADQYEYQVVNDTLSVAVDKICQILQDRGLLND